MLIDYRHMNTQKYIDDNKRGLNSTLTIMLFPPIALTLVTTKMTGLSPLGINSFSLATASALTLGNSLGSLTTSCDETHILSHQGSPKLSE